MNKIINLQDVVLNQVRKEKLGVIIHLMNGFQMSGYIVGFDSNVVIFESDGKQMMIYKHALSTITPEKSVVTPASVAAGAEQ